tara:strand:+ start:369 stop:515 length:147 start_codon:yes stop_codon:yes gene_type:complete
VEGDFDDEDEDDHWKESFENKEWSNLNPKMQQSLIFGFGNKKNKDKDN